MTRSTLVLFLASILCAAAPALNPLRIEDNSFLLEEAYNQERGELQLIQGLQHNPRSRRWDYTLTTEIPITDERHQFSFDLPLIHETGALDVGDVSLNYRYGVLQGERVFLAPRLTVNLPTGDSATGAGAGGFGYEAAIAATVLLGELFAVHGNVSYTWVPRAKVAPSPSVSTRSYGYGVSLVGLLTRWMNAFVELAGAELENAAPGGGTSARHQLLLNPGVRFALNVDPEFQIVPGVSVPIGIGPSSGETSIFTYLSMERKFW